MTYKLRPVLGLNIDLQEQIVKQGVDRESARYYLRWNAIPIGVFASLARVGLSTISRKIEPGTSIFEVVYPFPKLNAKGELDPMTGPKFILMNETAINYLKTPKHAIRHK